MEILWQDLRFALRSFWQAKTVTAVLLLGLMLGVGANSAIFSVVNAQLLRPLPYPGSDRLVTVRSRAPDRPERFRSVSHPDLEDVLRGSEMLRSAGTWSVFGPTLTGPGLLPERLTAAAISSGLFPTLGVAPVLGRGFTAAEDEYGAPGALVLSHALWRRLGGTPELVGQTLTLDGQRFEVVGVMPEGFRFPLDAKPAQLWASQGATLTSAEALRLRQARWMQAVARLADGAAFTSARAATATIGERLAREHASTNNGWKLDLEPLRERFLGRDRTALGVLLGAVGSILLISCANAAHLLLARSASRQQELAVRVALGASAGRLARQLLTESLLLGVGGGALGLLACAAAMPLLEALMPPELQRLGGLHVDGVVLTFTAGLSVLVGVSVGLAPVVVALRGDPNEVLKVASASASAGARSGRLRDGLVGAETAAAFVLLVGAGLVIRSAWQLGQVDPGFDAQGLFTASVTFFGYGQDKDPDTKVAATNTQLLERVRAMPGVQAATTAFPSAFGSNAVMSLPVDFEVGKQERINTLVVGGGYFDVMRIALARGRGIDARDDKGSAQVVVVNETLARAHWPGESPLGKRVTVRWESDARQAEVIGVARDVRHLGLDVPPAPEIYLPSTQWVMPASALLVRSELPGPALLAALRAELQAVDKELAIDRAEGLPALLAQSLAQRRFTLTLLSLFAFVAVALATLGIYGITSYAVSRRTRELGIRLALGARPRQVMALVLRRTLALAGLGLAVGLCVSLLLADVLRGLVYEISPTDPLTLSVLVLVLFGLATLAGYVPARRATRVDLLAALRSE